MITTDIDYPYYLPWPLREGYALNPVSPFIRTTMADGRARQRRRFSNVPTIVPLRWMFSDDTTAALFEVWFKTALKDGAEWFNCPLKTPVGEKQYVCRFTEMYRELAPIGNCGWTTSAELEIWERPLLPDVAPEVPDYLLRPEIFDIAMNREWPEA